MTVREELQDAVRIFIDENPDRSLFDYFAIGAIALLVTFFEKLHWFASFIAIVIIASIIRDNPQEAYEAAQIIGPAILVLIVLAAGAVSLLIALGFVVSKLVEPSEVER
jgi:hypothetical protein